MNIPAFHVKYTLNGSNYEHMSNIYWTLRSYTCHQRIYYFFYLFVSPFCWHRMKILLSVNWNISECPLNTHGMFTEIRISGIVQWPFSGHSVPLNAAEWQAHFSDHSVIFFNFQETKLKKKFIRLGVLKSYYYGLQRMK